MNKKALVGTWVSTTESSDLRETLVQFQPIDKDHATVTVYIKHNRHKRDVYSIMTTTLTFAQRLPNDDKFTAYGMSRSSHTFMKWIYSTTEHRWLLILPDDPSIESDQVFVLSHK